MYFRADETGFFLIYPNGTAQNSKCQCSQLDVEWWQSKSPNKNMVRWKYTTAIVQWVTRTIKVSKLVYCVLCILCICLLCMNQQMISQSKFGFFIFSYSGRGGDADSEGWVRLKKCSGKANSHQRTVVTLTHRVWKTTRWGNYSQRCSLSQIYAETMPSQVVQWLNETTGASTDPTGKHLPRGCVWQSARPPPPTPPPPYPTDWFWLFARWCQRCFTPFGGEERAICGHLMWVLMWACGQILLTGLLH